MSVSPISGEKVQINHIIGRIKFTVDQTKTKYFWPYQNLLKPPKNFLISCLEESKKNRCCLCWSMFLPPLGFPRWHSYLQSRVAYRTKVSHNPGVWWQRSESSGRSCSSCFLAPGYQSCCIPCWNQRSTRWRSGTTVWRENTSWNLFLAKWTQTRKPLHENDHRHFTCLLNCVN